MGRQEPKDRVYTKREKKLKESDVIKQTETPDTGKTKQDTGHPGKGLRDALI